MKRDDAPREAMPLGGVPPAGMDPAPAPAFRSHLAFHLTGHRIGPELEALERRGLRPALMAAYRDLSRLRYDFPLVFTSDVAERTWVRSLADIVDDLLRQVAPRGLEGEKLRRNLLRLEAEIRGRVAQGAAGTLLELWDQAASALASRDGVPLVEVLKPARAALKHDGAVADCDAQLPTALFIRAWQTVQVQKARSLRERIDRLVLKLSDILQADFARSKAGRSSAQLRASVGPAHARAFDFEAMSKLLVRDAAKGALPDSRRERIKRVRAVLQSQRFVLPGERRDGQGGVQAHGFVFQRCADALAAFRGRLPELIELVKAIATAELEIEGRYIELAHDRLFAEFDEGALGANDLGLFPDYVVCLRANQMADADLAALIDALASGWPLKILLQTDDLLTPSGSADARFAPNMRSMRLASMALGLADAFVMQCSASHLYQAREQLFSGLAQAGPALFSVYSGAVTGATGLSPYLAAAAAMQSRAFPAFAYDPAKGADWASRFTLEGNPQPERTWPREHFVYEDDAHQRIEDDLAFTFVDFVACDARHGAHFATVPRAQWSAGMVPLERGLGGDAALTPEEVPYALMVDEHNRLQRAIVHDKVLLAAERCAQSWRSLQELGGVHSSQAQRLLAQERKSWEDAKQKEIEALWREARPALPAAAPAAPDALAPTAHSAPSAKAEAAEPEAHPDEPYIETPRCTTCNECTNLNNRMFAYDANKQAYVADASAGTYRELVEAAESCQVSIIHPGKPRNPKEPGLDELLKRAAPFL